MVLHIMPLIHMMRIALVSRAREFGVVGILNLFERDGDHTFDCSPVIDADGSRP